MAVPATMMPPSTEIQETLSEGEQKFERWRNTVGLFLGPLAALTIYLIPMPTISAKAHTLAAILTLTVIFWVAKVDYDKPWKHYQRQFMQLQADETRKAIDDQLIRGWQAALVRQKYAPATVNRWLSGVSAHQPPYNPSRKNRRAKEAGITHQYKRPRNTVPIFLKLYASARGVEVHRANLIDLKIRDHRLVLAAHGKGRLEVDQIIVLAHLEAARLNWAAARGELVQLRTDRGYEMHRVAFPFVRPATETFVATLTLQLEGTDARCQNCSTRIPLDAPFCYHCLAPHFYEEA